MESFSSAWSKMAHGSRYEEREGHHGVLKKKTTNAVKGMILGILRGQSVTGNWAEHSFVLRPGEACAPSALEYYESLDGVRDRTPKGILFIDHWSIVHSNGRSKNGFYKFSVAGKNMHKENIEWKLKASNETDFNEWFAKLKAVTKARWENNAQRCSLCNLGFGLQRSVHHCRWCGQSVCSECSPHARALPGEGLAPVRVCTPCFGRLGDSSGVGNLVAADENDYDDDDD